MPDAIGCGPGWAIEPEVQRAADARREGENMGFRMYHKTDFPNDPEQERLANMPRPIPVPRAAIAELREWWGEVRRLSDTAAKEKRYKESDIVLMREDIVGKWDALFRAVVGERKEGG